MVCGPQPAAQLPMCRPLLLSLLLGVFLCVSVCSAVSSVPFSDGKDSCFCELYGEINDCACTVESVDRFNNLKIHPRLSSLLHKKFFRHFKVALHVPCPFWPDDGKCSMSDCHVKECASADIPVGLKDEEACGEKAEERELSKLDLTLGQDEDTFESWKKHDDSVFNFCDFDDENSNGAVYVDLGVNPERYTGYSGEGAWRVWRAIYEENCFQPDQDFNFLGLADSRAQCTEKRIFYRLVSGLHTSINVHLCANYFNKIASGLGDHKKSWGPNVAEFQRRFHPENAGGRGPHWLKNLYILYLVELRAIVRAKSYLEQYPFYTGDGVEDEETKAAMKDLLRQLEEFPDPFPDNAIFNHPDPALLTQFRTMFRNITKIMDCVGCDKCRVWGKLQVTGLGTALKLLFSPAEWDVSLRRTEIVTLLNAFGRLSNSIHHIEMFRQLAGSSDATAPLTGKGKMEL